MVAGRFRRPQGPPLDDILFGMSQNGKVSDKVLQNLKKALVHKDNTKRTNGTEGKNLTARDGDNGKDDGHGGSSDGGGEDDIDDTGGDGGGGTRIRK